MSDLLRFSDEAEEEIARLGRERDEARAEVERLRKLNDEQRISDARSYTEILNREKAQAEARLADVVEALENPVLQPCARVERALAAAKGNS